ncbi:hypothetical protein ILUMI_19050 [Ignelater luminosus]|uniref:DUF4371 domain-containing protein n=1 Tax=Ignelater luminosus TaxID=2038154 RepID=A0A8K0CGW1_IGNLU|nr:hypothetical protein ILUMI_19050 [Ignelater luminosus]
MERRNNKRKINTLDSFIFKKKIINDPDSDLASVAVTEPEASSSQNYKNTSTLDTCSNTQSVNSKISDDVDFNTDISNYVNCNVSKKNPNDILQNIWSPDPNFKFPSSGKRNLKFNFHWLNRWKWLAYSKKAATGGHQVLGKLIKKEFRNWKNALEVFAGHESTDYHTFSVTKFQNIGLIEEKKQDPIHYQLDLASKHIIEENRKRISPIIDTLILCGRQCISLRGHRDSGPIDSDIHPIENDRNFKAILRSKLRSGDAILRLHLESMSKTATDLSAKTQNKIINECGDIITKKIVNKINEAKFFSILADESTDISCIEQFSLCFRFYNSTTMKIEENFLKFVPVTNLTGQSLANVLITTLEGLNINSNFMVGQGCDGASSMSRAFRGCKPIFAQNIVRLFMFIVHLTL